MVQSVRALSFELLGQILEPFLVVLQQIVEANGIGVVLYSKNPLYFGVVHEYAGAQVAH